MAVISFFGINVEGLQVIYGPIVEDFLCSQQMGELKLNLGASQWVFGCDAMLLAEGILGKQGGTNFSKWGLV